MSDLKETASPHPNETGPAPVGRRSFFRWIIGGLSAAAAAVIVAPVAGFLLRTRKWDPQWVALGKADDYPPGETRLVTFDNPIRQPWDGIVAQTGVYVRNLSGNPAASDRFQVLAVNCAHLGCPVTWFPASGLFMCPCHGGVYYADGERASGPPPRGLYHCVWRVRRGQLEVQAPHYPTLQDTLRDEAT
jgi:menaquinol-cytochrome c reductase iron-sulfur subunit